LFLSFTFVSCTPERCYNAVMSHVTQILAAMESGDPSSAGQLLQLVYDELRQLAAFRLAAEQPGQTLQATALVHEAFLRLVDVKQAQHWNTRGHFFAAAAEAMRRILVENARRRRQLKRGAELQRTELRDVPIADPHGQEDLIDLDAALTKLNAVDPVSARLVQLRYFVGLTIPEAADVLEVSARSADRLWAFARAWLHREIAGSGRSSENSAEFLS
jgi:RNA polymerase sigma factor (TIGR02999 family)